MDTTVGTVVACRMRILFLDFDGVLHPGPHVATSLTHFCWTPILVHLTSCADVRFVIHSSWRHDYDLEELRSLLGIAGSRVIGATAHGPRWPSIVTWLGQSTHQIRDYRILDDTPEEFPSPTPDEVIVCRPELGLSERAVQASIRAWLGEE